MKTGGKGDAKVTGGVQREERIGIKRQKGRTSFITERLGKKIWLVREQDFSDRWLRSIQKWMILHPKVDASEPSRCDLTVNFAAEFRGWSRCF